MAFKKSEYKAYRKAAETLLKGSLMNPYFLLEYSQQMIEQEEYEFAKALKDVFDEWKAEFGYSEEECDNILYKTHPIYGSVA